MRTSIVLSGLRHLERHFVFTILSVGGLIIGLSTSIVIFLWTSRELSFDRQYPDNERVFLILDKQQHINGEEINAETTPIPLAEHLKSTLPEVEQVSRTGYGERLLFSTPTSEAYGFGHGADSTHFSIFHHTVLSGDPRRMLPDNNSIAIS